MTDLDTPAIGRKIARLSAARNLPQLVTILTGTHSDQWPHLARAFLLAIEADNVEQAIPGVLYVWNQLVKETQ